MANIKKVKADLEGLIATDVPSEQDLRDLIQLCARASDVWSIDPNDRFARCAARLLEAFHCLNRE